MQAFALFVDIGAPRNAPEVASEVCECFLLASPQFPVISISFEIHSGLVVCGRLFYLFDDWRQLLKVWSLISKFHLSLGDNGHGYFLLSKLRLNSFKLNVLASDSNTSPSGAFLVQANVGLGGV